MITNLFIRIYAMNLRRSWRNSIEAAWTDAIYTTDILVGLPLICLGVGTWSVAAFNWPIALGVFGASANAQIGAVVAICLLVDFALSKKMKRYKAEVTRDQYRTTGDIIKVAMAFVLSVTIAVSSILAAGFLRKPH